MLNADIVRPFGVLLPNQKPATLYSRQVDQTLGAGVVWRITRRRNTTHDDLQGSGLILQKDMTTFSMWNADSLTTLPAMSDVLVDWQGKRWVVQWVTEKICDVLQSCVCVLEIPTT